MLIKNILGAALIQLMSNSSRPKETHKATCPAHIDSKPTDAIVHDLIVLSTTDVFVSEIKVQESRVIQLQ
jgi:hypothetical protein